MKINIENSYKNRSQLDIHSEVWERPQDEVITFLTKSVDNWNQAITQLEKLQERTFQEEKLFQELKKYISIITA